MHRIKLKNPLKQPDVKSVIIITIFATRTTSRNLINIYNFVDFSLSKYMYHSQDSVFIGSILILSDKNRTEKISL